MHSSSIASYTKVPLLRPKSLLLENIFLRKSGLNEVNIRKIFRAALSPVFQWSLFNRKSPQTATLLPSESLPEHITAWTALLSGFLSPSFSGFSFTTTQLFFPSSALLIPLWMSYACPGHMHYFWAHTSDLTQRNLRMLLTYSRYLILFCPKGPVCNYFAWEIKHDWDKSVVKGNHQRRKERSREDQKLSTNNTRKIHSVGTQTKKPNAYYIQNWVSNPYISCSEDPGSENDRSKGRQ